MRSIRQLYFSFFSKIGIAVLIFSICRILFYLLNQEFLGPLTAWNIIGGIRFDLMTITILYAPFIFSHLILFRGKSVFLKVLFHFSNTIAIVLNCIDLEYFKFTSKRTTSDLFTTQGMAADVGNLLPQFIQDFWYIGLIIIALIILSNYLYNRSLKIEVEKPARASLLFFLIPTLTIIVIGARGGIQLRPLGVLYASQYATSQNIPVVLNTPFTVIKSSYKEDLKAVHYIQEDKLNGIYNPVQHFTADSMPKKLNVVLIIAESFSEEYIGHYNPKSSHTPFLDSLIKESLSFKNTFANGKKSIEALPAILAGIPTLMNSSYISSKYASNQINSIATSLKKQGYQTAFYHGGANGTMGFNAFTQIAGIDRYIGLNEYPNKKDHDGNWGIFDEPFLQFCLNDFKQSNKPFFASIFTLSSHHPYPIPKQYKDRFKEGKIPILKSIEYADFALKQFFEAAQKEDWFEETLFIITADHTSKPLLESYNNRTGVYEIPLLFYAPKYIQAEEKTKVVQQSDIYPSIIDFLGFEETLTCFGQSVFMDKSEGFSVSYLNEKFQLIQGNYCLEFDGEKSISLNKFKNDKISNWNIIDKKPEVVEEMETKLKAIIQQYNSRVINNQMLEHND